MEAAEVSELSDTPDTVLLCHFNEGQGNVAQDASKAGNGRGGKLIGNPVWTQGQFGGGLLLDGKSDAVDFGPYGVVFATASHTPGTAGSVEFWFSTAQDIRGGKSTLAVIVDCCQSPRFAIGSSGELEVSYVAGKWTGENVHVLKSGITEWKAGAWHHVLFTWNEKGHFLFVNDTPMASDNLGCGVLAGPINVTVGAYYNGKGWSSHFAGQVDELRITRPVQSRMTETLPSGIIKETRQCRGTITGNIINYCVHYPPDKKNLPILFHHYVIDITMETNERIAGYGIFCASIEIKEYHGGYGLQDYKDAMDDIYRNYAGRIDTGDVTIMGASYGGATAFGMAVRFPYLFDAVVPVFGIADFGYDEEKSWFPMVLKNSPKWGTTDNMIRLIGDRTTYRETRYLVRNAIFGAKNNPYAHFEILHDVNDGIGRAGVQVEQSRRYVAELERLGYKNYRYVEVPKEGYVFPKDERLPQSVWGRPITFGHGFFKKENAGLYHFELFTLKPGILTGVWKRPPFRKTGELFIPAYLEVPCFRFDLGSVENNCDEAADVRYDVTSPDRYTFRIAPRTTLTKLRLRVMKLKPGKRYEAVCKREDTKELLKKDAMKADEAGTLVFAVDGLPKNAALLLECTRQ